MTATCADIFTSLPERFDPKGAGTWQTTIQFEIAGDGGGSWTLTVKDGACAVARGSTPQPVATLRTDAATWVGMHTGKVNPMTAFMTGKLKVDGAMGELMKLNNPAIFKKA